MNKFEVGDIIVDKMVDGKPNGYVYTCGKEFVGKVTEIISENTIRVTILECHEKRKIGCEYKVYAGKFEYKTNDNIIYFKKGGEPCFK